MACKAAETICNINNAFGPKLLWVYSVVVVQDVLQRRREPWRWGSIVAGHQRLTTSSWEPARLKLILLQLQKLLKNLMSAIQQLFVIRSKLERWKGFISGGILNWSQIKKSCWSVIFYFMQQWTISRLDCDVQWKMDLHDNCWWLAQWLDKAAAPKHFPKSSSVQFSCSDVSNSLWSHEPQHARPHCPSPTPRVHPNPCPLSQWCHPTISSSLIPFSSCLQSLPASRSFKWVSSSHQVAKVLKFQLQHHSFQWTPSQTCTKKRLWALFGGLLPVWSPTAFWILVRPLHLESMLRNQWDALKTTIPIASNGQQKEPNSSPWQHLTTHHTTKTSKAEWTGLWSFTSSAVFTWPLTTTTSSSISKKFFLQGRHFYYQQEAENAFKEFVKSQSTDFYATGINTYFSLAQMCWL